MTYIERIVDSITGEIVEREYSKSEIEEVEAAKLKLLQLSEIESKQAIDKASLLAKLGITEDEAKLLLG